jgi:hypothetical protein
MSGDPETYLAFLADHQPMPPDDNIGDAEAGMFTAALKHFESRPDDRCVPLFINAVSINTGLGMYEHIKVVLMKDPRDVVVRHLRTALQSPNAGVRYRSCWWASDVNATELSLLIRPLLTDEDEDVRVAAAAFLGQEPQE